MSEIEIVRVEEIVKETPSVRTLRFKDKRKAKAGQFVMVWIPGVDEIPISLSYLNENKGITVQKIGEATAALHGLHIGDKIGIRGPIGNWYEIKGKNILLVGGGSGMASLASVAENLIFKGKEIEVAIGAVTEDELLFVERIKRRGIKLHIATDDGSCGYQGFVSTLAKNLVKERKYDQIITCGPERMMKKIIDLALENDIRIQASLERFMKCGIGICDACAVNGLHVCKDGPVFDGELLFKLSDFGRWRRDASGKRIKIE